METLIHGDCLEKLKEIPDNSIDSIVTDPPYGLSFMGKKWDYDVPSIEIWKECLRVLKPGGYLLSFAGTRTQHRMAVRIEDAGFEIRDMIAWIYASGFPKSLNIGKAVDKLQGNEREIVGEYQVSSDFTDHKGSMMSIENSGGKNKAATINATKGTSEWEGWGTALKPALEPITVARKSLIGTVAENILTHGTGGLNIDGSRVGTEEVSVHNAPKGTFAGGEADRGSDTESYRTHTGRWPANLIHDGSEEVLECFPNVKGATSRTGKRQRLIGQKEHSDLPPFPVYQDFDNTSAARFFYCAKASKKDRDEGLEGFEGKFAPTMGNGIGGKEHDPETATPKRNAHPTVKPTALMRYLVKLVTPKGGTVLDPFTGSGSTGKACKLEGFNFIGVEREEEYVKIARARIEAVSYTPTLL